MSDTIIRVENLGKKYLLSHMGRRGYKNYTALRDVLMEAALMPFRSFRRRVKRSLDDEINADAGSSSREDFWALKDISFEVKRGESVGIIGRNGAGKSTLLKLLSRITEPTTGRIELDGKVASLLEVGTGFHPELTGRENIYLNGAILGMRRAEIRAKFDEIVAFAEVEKFLDTPVKRYSSGMYVRLAFAVAAHLEPDILIVDEVLAVGDVQFQKKCLGKMKDVSTRQGRTVLFVSHNMAAVRGLCQTGIVLEAGRIKCLSTVEEALRVYSESIELRKVVKFDVDGSHPAITSISVDSSQMDKGNLVVDIGFKSPFPLNPPVGGINIYSSSGAPVYGSNCRFHNEGYGQPKLSEGILRMTVNDLPVHGGVYNLSVWLGDWQGDYDEKREILAFEFKHGHPPSNAPNPETIGFIDIPGKWSIV